jgi:hypothetical protein
MSADKSIVSLGDLLTIKIFLNIFSEKSDKSSYRNFSLAILRTFVGTHFKKFCEYESGTIFTRLYFLPKQ